MIQMNAHSKTCDRLVLRQKAVFSPRNASVSEWTLPRILKIKISRDTKQFLWKNPLRKKLPSTILLFSLSFLFLLTISRPPGGLSKQKKSFTPLGQRLSRLLDLTPLLEASDRLG